MQRIQKYGNVIFGLLFVAITYNLFFAPLNLVTGGVSGLAIIMKHLFWINESFFILITNIILLLISYFVLGKDLTKNTLLGSLLLPIMIQITSNINELINLDGLEMLIKAILGGIISGIGYGMIFKNNFTSGGTDILNQIAEKKFKIPISKSMIYIDGSIVLLGCIIFGIESMVYSIIALLFISTISNKTMLGIHNNKIFYIQTKKMAQIKRYLIQDLKYDVTIFEGIGGFSQKKKQLILCSVKTSDYYKVKTGIELLDQEALIIITENYELLNENLMVPKKLNNKN